MTVGNDHQFRKFTEVLGIPEAADDERYVSNGVRVDHREELTALLEEALAARTASEWQESLTEVGVPAGKVGGIDEGVALAEELGLEPTVDVQDRTGATVGRQFRHPAQWTPPLASPTQAPPQLGEDTDTVVQWLREPRDK